MRVLWVHTGSWKSHAAISYIGVHNAWSFAQIGYETHLLMPDSSSKSDTDLDLRSFYGLEPHPLLHIHRINLKRNWWNLRHPYFAFAEHMARKGELGRMVLEAIRESGGPVTSIQITALYCERRGISRDAKTFANILSRVFTCLTKMKRSGVVRKVQIGGRYRGWTF